MQRHETICSTHVSHAFGVRPRSRRRGRVRFGLGATLGAPLLVVAVFTGPVRLAAQAEGQGDASSSHEGSATREGPFGLRSTGAMRLAQSDERPSAARSRPGPLAVFEDRPVVGVDFTSALPPPVDAAAFPPPPPTGPAPQRPWFEVHGFLSVWVTPWQDTASVIQRRDLFFPRFTILRVDGRPADSLRLLVRLNFQAPTNPLLDMMATWEPHDAFAISLGQMRIPFGASATTLAPQLVFPDRPRYVSLMLKRTFRDIGVMLHSGERGVANGLFHYRLAVMNGSGRLGVGTLRGTEAPERFLYTARLMVDLGRRLFTSPRDRFVLGASYVRSRDPSNADVSSSLGQALVSTTSDRETQLFGVDATLAISGFFLQLEWMFLDSVVIGASTHREVHGASLEMAYRLPFQPYEGAGFTVSLRAEMLEPDTRTSGDESGVVSAGFDFDASHGARVGLFGSAIVFRSSASLQETAVPEIFLRAHYSF